MKATEKLQNGQVGRMVSQSLHSKISYDPNDWLGAVKSDLLGEQRISLQTPSPSIGEMVTNKKLQQQAVNKAIKSGHKEILKRAYQAQKEEDFERSAQFFLYIGKKTKICVLFGKGCCFIRENWRPFTGSKNLCRNSPYRSEQPS